MLILRLIISAAGQTADRLVVVMMIAVRGMTVRGALLVRLLLLSVVLQLLLLLLLLKGLSLKRKGRQRSLADVLLLKQLLQLGCVGKERRTG